MYTLKVAPGIDMAKSKAFAERLVSRSAELSGLHLTINNNKSTLISCREQKNGDRVLSIHNVFLECSDDILLAIANWYLSKQRERSAQTLRYYIDSHYYTSCPVSSKELSLVSRGVVHDLSSILDDLNREYFSGRMEWLRITWMRGVREITKNRSTIIFGNYDVRLKLISIHPCLDSAKVPIYFLRFVVYHEMLHAQLDPERRPGKRHVVHTSRFRMLESRFTQYKESKQWEQEYLHHIW